MRRALWTLAVLLSHWRRHPMQLATLLIGLISLAYLQEDGLVLSIALALGALLALRQRPLRQR